MSATRRKSYVPWRDRAFVTFAEAADIAGRSRTWVDDQVTAGRLDAWRLPSGGPALISVESLRRFLDGAEILDLAERRRVRGRRPVLLVDNS